MASSNTQTAPRWTVTNATLPTTVGVNASGTVNLTISNIVNGVYSGRDLDAQNFKIGGASLDSSYSGSGFKWTGGNVDSEVNFVIFTNNGTAGDPANTVNAAVTLNTTAITNSNRSQNIYVDIDEVVTTQEIARREACIQTVYPNPYGTDHTVTVTNITTPDITETTLGNSSATPGGVGWSNLNVTRHSGLVDENTTSKIAEISFVAGDSHYYAGPSTNQPAFVSFQNLSQGQNGYGDYTSAYSYNFFDIVIDAYGVIKSWKIEVLYTPPTTGVEAQDPSEGMCALQHKIFIEYMLNGVPALAQGMIPLTSGQTGGTINNVSYPKDLRVTGGNKAIEVRGTPGAKFTIKIQKTQGHDNNAVATSGGYYNFTSELWQDGSTSATRTIPAGGVYQERVNIPFSSSNARYDVIIGSSASSTLASGVPTSAGDAKMLQYGNATFTLTPTTSTDTNFGTLPSSISITKPSSKGRFNRQFYLANQYRSKKLRASGATEVRGQSRGTSSTRLIVDDKRIMDRIKPGMRIKSSTGSIAHDTTVVSVDKKSNKVELSSAQAISATNLTFEPVYGEKNFEFIITPGTEGDLTKTLNVNTDNNIYDSLNKKLGIPQSLTKTVDGATSNSTTVVLDNVEQIVPGLTFAVGDTTRQVEAVTTDTNRTITINTAASLSDNQVLTFTGGAGEVYITSSEIVKVGNNIHIRGSIKCDYLEGDVTVNMNIDNLINVT